MLQGLQDVVSNTRKSINFSSDEIEAEEAKLEAAEEVDQVLSHSIEKLATVAVKKSRSSQIDQPSPRSPRRSRKEALDLREARLGFRRTPEGHTADTAQGARPQR